MNFLLEVIAYDGGSAVVAYMLFRWPGKTWIENKFSEHLDLLRHQHALDIQRLRVEIGAI